MFHPRRLLLVAASSLALTGLSTLPAVAVAQAQAESAQSPAGAPAPVPVWAHETSDIPADPAVRFGQLPNGMRYALMKNATPPGQAALRLRIGAGSLMESDQQLGLAHFMEHMAFNDTTNLPKNELLRTLERLGLAFGADNNAYTSFDETVYVLQLPRTNDETVDTALNIMREQVSEALMDGDSIDQERGVVEGEQRTRNTPSYRNLVAQLQLLAPEMLLPKRLPIGDLSIIRTAPRDRFVEFYHAYYRPERATLIAVGDFDVDRMEAKIKAQFASWQGKGENGPNPDLGTLSQREPATHILVEPGVQSTIQLVWVREPDLSPDTQAARIRGAKRSLALAILNRRLGEIARADNPPFLGAGASGSSLYRSLDSGSLSAAFNPGGLKRALEAVEQEQRRMFLYGVTQAEIDREITVSRTNLDYAVKAANTRDTTALVSGLLSSVGSDSVFTTPEYRQTLFESYAPDLTVEAINSAFKEVFEGQGPLILVTTPTAIEGGEAGVTQALLDSQAVEVKANDAREALTWSYTDFGPVGTVASTTAFAPMDATVVNFANGVRLIVKPTDFKKEEIYVSLRTGTGTLGVAADRFDPLSMGPSLYTSSGLGRYTADELSRVLAGRVYSVSLGVDDDHYRFSGSTRLADLDLQMQVMAGFMTDPGMRPAPLAQLKAYYPQYLAQAVTSPSGAFNLKAAEDMANGDARNKVPSLEDVLAVDNDQLKQALIQALSTGPIEIVMVGDVTVEAATSAVAKTFGAMPPRPERAATLPGSDQRQFPAPTPEPKVYTHEGQEDQGMATIMWPTTDQIKDRTTARRLSLLRALIQLRATEEIREKRGIAYSPSVFASSSSLFKDYGSFGLSAEIKPENFDDFFEAVDAIVTDITSAPPSADEVERARAPMIESHKRSLDGNSYWLGNLEGVVDDPEELAERQSYLSELSSITPEQLQDVAKTYLRPETAWKAIVKKGD